MHDQRAWLTAVLVATTVSWGAALGPAGPPPPAAERTAAAATDDWSGWTLDEATGARWRNMTAEEVAAVGHDPNRTLGGWITVDYGGPFSELCCPEPGAGRTTQHTFNLAIFGEVESVPMHLWDSQPVRHYEDMIGETWVTAWFNGTMNFWEGEGPHTVLSVVYGSYRPNPSVNVTMPPGMSGMGNSRSHGLSLYGPDPRLSLDLPDYAITLVGKCGQELPPRPQTLYYADGTHGDNFDGCPAFEHLTR